MMKYKKQDLRKNEQDEDEDFNFEYLMKICE